MYAVERLGSYITRGVHTVSGPFHPFGGAVDIIVVEQQDGSFKSSPWYVRFGKFQGVLKAKEKVVNVSVNGVESDFHMCLDHKGEALFFREVDVDEVDSSLYPTSSSDETDGQSQDRRRTFKSKSCNYDVNSSITVQEMDKSDVKIVARTNSRRSRLLGLVFGRKSMKGDGYRDESSGAGVARVDSLERAEIAANLLEVKWSTNLASARLDKDNASRLYHLNLSDNKSSRESQVSSYLQNNVESNFDHGLPHESVVEEVRAELSESSALATDCSSVQTREAIYISGGGIGGIHLHPETLQPKAGPLCELAPCFLDDEATKIQHNTVNEIVDNTYTGIEAQQVENHKNHNQETNSFCSQGLDSNVMDLQEPSAIAGSGEEANSPSICTISTSCNSNLQLEDEKSKKGENITSTSQPSMEAVGNRFLTKAVSMPASISSDEEQFSFSDLITQNSETQSFETHYLASVDEENHPSHQAGFEGVKSSVNRNAEPSSSPSPDRLVNENLHTDLENSMRTSTSPIKIPKSYKVDGDEVAGMVVSLPNIGTHMDNTVESDIHIHRSHSLDSNSRSLKWTKLEIVEAGFNAEENRQEQLLEKQNKIDEPHVLGEVESVYANLVVGDSLKATVARSESWRIWPFSFRRSRSRKAVQPAEDFRDTDAENASERNIGTDRDTKILNTKVEKRKVKAMTPTSEQLASLNLKEGRNKVTFTFSTAMLGKQQVDALIYLWKWNTRIVISDVDGTITKSDVLGQFMPMVGMDWSQTGVAHLFSAIKENGYQMLFLSARAISQAYHTRQFLFNLKQNGKALPEGPVVISPDGLLPSLYREVIRRAPHEFKIACLEKIRELFPSDCNPFYAGFGNRDTDEISYLKVGIPKGKIFIINPKGEVAVNRRVDTKSYTSFHALVNDMFPSMASSEQEDYNSWNFWRLPPPNIDI